MFNEATVVGRIGKKDVKNTKTGASMCTLSIATRDKQKLEDGKHGTTWHFVNCFSKLGENVIQYCNVGDIVLAKGEIRITKMGEQTYYAIHANEVKFIQKGQQKEKEHPQYIQKTISFNDDLPDDIPF